MRAQQESHKTLDRALKRRFRRSFSFGGNNQVKLTGKQINKQRWRLLRPPLVLLPVGYNFDLARPPAHHHTLIYLRAAPDKRPEDEAQAWEISPVKFFCATCATCLQAAVCRRLNACAAGAGMAGGGHPDTGQGSCSLPSPISTLC